MPRQHKTLKVKARRNWVRPTKQPRNGMMEYGCLVLILFGFGILASWLLQSAGSTASNSLGTTRFPLGATPSEPTRQTASSKSSNRINLLVLGIDRRPGEQCPCRSDVMILSTLDPDSMTAGLITIPRDLYVSIPTVGTNRINTAMYYGELKNYPGKGPGLAKATIERVFGRTVQHYVVVDFNGFRRLVDALGGIDLNVPQAINDPTYPNDTYGYKPLHIPAGLVHMNGEMALAYARTRHQDNDFGRSKRQIQVLLAMRDRALRLDVIPRLPGLVQALWGIVETDLSPKEVISLAQVASGVKPENIKSASLDETMTTELYARDGEYLLIPNLTKISRLFDQMIPLSDNGVDVTAKLRQEAASIIVLNGTESAGLAEHTALFLMEQGFANVAFDNADRFDYAKTLIASSGRNLPSTIDALASIFHLSVSGINFAADPKNRFDVRVILGKDWVLPQSPAQR